MQLQVLFASQRLCDVARTIHHDLSHRIRRSVFQRYKRDQRTGEVPLHEMVCAENNSDHFDQGLVPIPQADKPDF